MLPHGFKEMHERQILLPTQLAFQPDRDWLALRYQALRGAP
jgi:hypothetical protein